MKQCLNDFRLSFGGRQFLPLMVGGLGVNISTASLVLAIERLGGIAHLSDAMMPDVADRELGTHNTAERTRKYRIHKDERDKSCESFDLAAIARSTRDYVRSVMDRATGRGLVLINCMEKLTMNDSLGTLKARLTGALDGGVNGITLSAGLHLSSFRLIADHPRFRQALLGIVVSSQRALQLFLKRTEQLGRLPDYVVVEGPLAGGHLGFGEDWKDFSLEKIVREVKDFIKEKSLSIPVLAAGGIFDGKDATRFVSEVGADGVQVATRFTIAQECGLPEAVKEAYINARDEDVDVNHMSPTGYLMRMLKQSPAIASDVRPNCESYGYLLSKGSCPYLKEWHARHGGGGEGAEPPEHTKCCLCTHMRNYKVWTCGATVSRLKETVSRDSSGRWRIPTAEEIFLDYKFG
ncbi:MAG: nitronate monooxygenase [Duodenibacillus sp.]|nr:nitronate monooxygenase [Duodenibacillus sp.]